MSYDYMSSSSRHVNEKSGRMLKRNASFSNLQNLDSNGLESTPSAYRRYATVTEITLVECCIDKVIANKLLNGPDKRSPQFLFWFPHFLPS